MVASYSVSQLYFPGAKWAVAYHAPNDGKASTFYSDQFNKGEFELVVLYIVNLGKM